MCVIKGAINSVFRVHTTINRKRFIFGGFRLMREYVSNNNNRETEEDGTSGKDERGFAGRSKIQYNDLIEMSFSIRSLYSRYKVSVPSEWMKILEQAKNHLRLTCY